MPDTVTCCLRIDSILGESPVWHPEEGRLYWLDLLRPALYCLDPRNGRNTALDVALGNYVGGLAPRANGEWVVDNAEGVFAVDRAAGTLRPLADPEPGRPENWFNDAKCDRRGWLWAGTGDRGETSPTGSLYRIAPDLGSERIDTGIICSNGPAFSPDGRLAYFTDSYVRQIYAYDLDPASGAVGPRRLFAEVPEPDVYPDGMTVDADGYLWSAQWGGSRIVRYAPDGSIERTLRLPVPQVTSCAFGGHDLTTLYVTSATRGMSATQLAEAPLSGSIFACRVGVRGLAEPRFAG